MTVECPCCHETCETSVDLVIGQHVVCPFCGVKFAYGVNDDSSHDESHGFVEGIRTAYGKLCKLGAKRKSVVVCALALVMLCLCRCCGSGGGDGWRVERGKNNGELETRIIVDGAVTKPLKTVFKMEKGYYVVISEDRRCAKVYLQDVFKKGDGESPFIYSGIYELSEDWRWECFVTSIHEYTKYETANEILEYVRKRFR